MTMIKRTGIYLLGLFILAFGISVSVKSNLGVSPVSSVPYVLGRIANIEMGYFSMAVYTFFVFVQLFMLRREFKFISFIQIFASVAFGYFVNFSNYLLRNFETPDPMILRILLAVVSAVLTGYGVFLYIAPKLIPLPAEGLIGVIATKAGKPFSKIKVYFDFLMVVVSLLISLAFLGKIDGIGIGTIISALLIGRFVGIFSELFMGRIQRFLGNPREKEGPLKSSATSKATIK